MYCIVNRGYNMSDRLKHIVDDFYSVEETGNIPVNRNGAVLINNKPTYGTKSDYRYVMVNYKRYPVHRLVAITFLTLPDNYIDLDVNHKDGDKYNNNVSNLEWCTRKENNDHAVTNGLNSQAKTLLVKNLFNNIVLKFDSIQRASKYFNCAGGAIHNYLKLRTIKPFRGHWSIILNGEDWPKFKDNQITLFGYGSNDCQTVIGLSITDNKHIVYPNLESVLNIDSNIKINKQHNGYIYCYLLDLNKFTESINDVLSVAIYRYDLLKFNRNPVNKVPKKVRMTNKDTGSVIIFDNARKCAEYLNMKYQALKRSIWRTKGDFKGYLFEYIN